MTRRPAGANWMLSRVSLLCACLAALISFQPTTPTQSTGPARTLADICDEITVSALAPVHSAKRVTVTSQIDDGVLSQHPLLSPSERHGVSPPTLVREAEPRRATNTARGPPTSLDDHPTLRTT